MIYIESLEEVKVCEWVPLLNFIEFIKDNTYYICTLTRNQFQKKIEAAVDHFNTYLKTKKESLTGFIRLLTQFLHYPVYFYRVGDLKLGKMQMLKFPVLEKAYFREDILVKKEQVFKE